jgi:hypothetical protein
METRYVEVAGRSAVKSAVVLAPGADGQMTATVYRERRRKRRVSKTWRPLEKAVRRMSTAQATAVGAYLDRHERSNQKKKDGWVKDFGDNVVKASRKGAKKMKIRIL